MIKSEKQGEKYGPKSPLKSQQSVFCTVITNIIDHFLSILSNKILSTFRKYSIQGETIANQEVLAVSPHSNKNVKIGQKVR